MADKAKRTVVFQTALAAAFVDGVDVVGFPAGGVFQAIGVRSVATQAHVRPAFGSKRRNDQRVDRHQQGMEHVFLHTRQRVVHLRAVDATFGADAAVALEEFSPNKLAAGHEQETFEARRRTPLARVVGARRLAEPAQISAVLIAAERRQVLPAEDVHGDSLIRLGGVQVFEVCSGDKFSIRSECPQSGWSSKQLKYYIPYEASKSSRCLL